MPKYEAVINLTVEVDEDSPESADSAILGELTDRLLETASRDTRFKLWLDVIQIDEVL